MFVVVIKFVVGVLFGMVDSVDFINEDNVRGVFVIFGEEVLYVRWFYIYEYFYEF